MNKVSACIRSVLYPMVAIIMVGSLWVLASAHAAADRNEPEFLGPLQIERSHLVPPVVAVNPERDAR